MNDALRSFGQRWNKKASTKVIFDPEDEVLHPGPIPFGILAVDLMLGGGIPRGRTTVFIGEEQSGKTLLSQLAIAAAQRQGGTAMFFDIERTFDAKWFARTGVDIDPEKLIVIHPENLEQGFDMVVDALIKVKPDIIVMDSVSAMVPKDVLKVTMEEKDFRGLDAKKITAGIKKVTQYNQDTALIIINQLRVSMGVVYGNPESQPGGKGLKFHTSLRVRVRRGARLTTETENGKRDADGFLESDDKDARLLGFIMRLRAEKNKCAPIDWEGCDIKFFFDGSVDSTGSLIHLAQQRGIIEATGSWFKLPGIEAKLHGLPAVEKAIREDEDLKARLVAEIQGQED
jgi:recombination protein RecA